MWPANGKPVFVGQVMKGGLLAHAFHRSTHSVQDDHQWRIFRQVRGHVREVLTGGAIPVKIVDVIARTVLGISAYRCIDG